MRFTLDIDLGNEAMQTPADVLAAITKSLNRSQLAPVEPDTIPTRILDGNGNTVGSWRIAEDPHEAIARDEAEIPVALAHEHAARALLVLITDPMIRPHIGAQALAQARAALGVEGDA